MTEILSLSSSKESKSTPKSPEPRPAETKDWGASIPEVYGQTCVVLLPRDPAWMFCYWELTEATAKNLKLKHGEDIFLRSTPTLRRFRVHPGKEHPQTQGYVDTSIALPALNWYLQAEEEGTTWLVELGLKLSNGEFIVIARSNVVTLPRGKVSPLTEEHWVHVQTEELLSLSGGGKTGAGSLEIAKRIAEGWNILTQTSSRIGSGGVSSSFVSALRKT